MQKDFIWIIMNHCIYTQAFMPFSIKSLLVYLFHQPTKQFFIQKPHQAVFPFVTFFDIDTRSEAQRSSSQFWRNQSFCEQL